MYNWGRVNVEPYFLESVFVISFRSFLSRYNRITETEVNLAKERSSRKLSGN